MGSGEKIERSISYSPHRKWEQRLPESIFLKSFPVGAGGRNDPSIVCTYE
jgi:hypothetical protein